MAALILKFPGKTGRAAQPNRDDALTGDTVQGIKRNRKADNVDFASRACTCAIGRRDGCCPTCQWWADGGARITRRVAASGRTAQA